MSALSERTQRRCIFAAAGPLITSVVVIGATTPGYRPWADAVSRLASTDEPHSLLMRIGLVLYGVFVVAGAAALGTHAPGRERLLSLLIGGYGLAAVVAGPAPKDPPRSPHTLASRLHIDATLVGGALFFAAVALVARSSPDPVDRRIATTVGALTAIAVAVFPFTWGTPVYGLIEIFLLTAATAWFVVLANRIRVTTRGAS